MSQGGSARVAPQKVQLEGSPGRPANNLSTLETESVQRSQLPPYIIHPNRPAKLMWDSYAILILLYTIVIAPLRLGFDVEDFCPAPIWLWEALVDTSFIVDLVLNFCTAVYIFDKNGREVLCANSKTIALQYLRTWFTIDFVSCLPIDMVVSLSINGCSGNPTISVASGVNGSVSDDESPNGLELLKMLRILRLVKLLKILRVLRLQQRFNSLADRFPVIADLTIFRLLPPIFATLYVSHVLACGFYMVGAASYYDALERVDNDVDALPPRVSWLDVSGLPMKDFPGLDWDEVFAPYAAALYWTFTTITTVGYGDLIPANASERFYASASMLIGTGIFGNIISCMTNILAEAHSESAARASKLRALNAFMSSKALPFDLQVRIRRFFRFFWQHSFTNDISEDELLEQLSLPLRQEALRVMYSTLHAEVPMFALTDDEHFRNALLRAMHPVLLTANEVLMEQGTVGDMMYLITQGSLEVTYTPTDQLLEGEVAEQREAMKPRYVCDVGAGDHVGEIAIFEEQDLQSICEGSPRSRSMITQRDSTWATVLRAADDLEDEAGEAARAALDRAADNAAIEAPRNVRTATVRAWEPCELFSVKHSDFVQICRAHKAAKKKLLTLAKTRLERTERIQRDAEQETRSVRVNAAKFTAKLQMRRQQTLSAQAAKASSDTAASDEDVVNRPAERTHKDDGGKVGRTARGLIEWQHREASMTLQEQRDTQVTLNGTIDYDLLAKKVTQAVMLALRAERE